MDLSVEALCQQINKEFPMDVDLLAAIVVSIGLDHHLLLDRGRHPRTLVDRYLSLLCKHVLGVDNIAIIQCTPDMKWDDLLGMLMKDREEVPSIIILSSLDCTSRYIQALILSVITSRRFIYQNKEYTLKPRTFIMGIVNRSPHKRSIVSGLIHHMRDYFLLVHEINPQFNLSIKQPLNIGQPLIDPEYLDSVRSNIPSVTVVTDIRRYMQDIVVFLRTHRLVRSGISPKAVRDFTQLARAMSLIQGYTYVTPTLAARAARIKLPLVLTICQPQDEPTIQYGGDIALIRPWIKKWDSDIIIDDVLRNCPPPI